MVGLRAVLRSLLPDSRGDPGPHQRAQRSQCRGSRCLPRAGCQRSGALLEPAPPRRPGPGPGGAPGSGRQGRTACQRVPSRRPGRSHRMDLRQGPSGRRHHRPDHPARPLPRHHAEEAHRGGAARYRGALPLRRREHPGRGLSLRMRRDLDDAVHERPHRGPRRLPRQRLHRQQGSHLRLGHPP